MKKFIAAIAATMIMSVSAQASGWTIHQSDSFAQELYNSAKSEGNWDSHTNNEELELMTDCITRYYSETIEYELAQEYLYSMPAYVAEEFNQVIVACYDFVRSNRNTNYL